MTLNVQDFQILKDRALEEFAQRIASVSQDICWEFDIEVSRLESQVIQLYGIAALLARREDDVDKVAEIWAAMITVCDEVAAKILDICDEHPFCSASHDKILDIRNKCARLRELHS